jgi:hypothetical protein
MGLLIAFSIRTSPQALYHKTKEGAADWLPLLSTLYLSIRLPTIPPTATAGATVTAATAVVSWAAIISRTTVVALASITGGGADGFGVAFAEFLHGGLSA